MSAKNKTPFPFYHQAPDLAIENFKKEDKEPFIIKHWINPKIIESEPTVILNYPPGMPKPPDTNNTIWRPYPRWK